MYWIASVAAVILVSTRSGRLFVDGQDSIQLPAGAELIVGPVRTTFRCPPQYGYYADVENDCKVFHVCSLNGARMDRYSFLCGNLTVFDQFTLTCTLDDRAVPCESATDFFYLNEKIGGEQAVLHEDEDVARVAKLVPFYDRFADSPTRNGRPGGKPSPVATPPGFNGRAFFTNRDRTAASSVRSNRNETVPVKNVQLLEHRLNQGEGKLRDSAAVRLRGNPVYVPVEGGLLNVARNAPLREGHPMGNSARRQRTPSFGTLPGYGDRLNLDVINFRDRDFRVRRLDLRAISGDRRDDDAVRDDNRKFITTGVERVPAESMNTTVKVDVTAESLKADPDHSHVKVEMGNSTADETMGEMEQMASSSESLPPLSTTEATMEATSTTTLAPKVSLSQANNAKSTEKPVVKKLADTPKGTPSSQEKSAKVVKQTKGGNEAKSKASSFSTPSPTASSASSTKPKVKSSKPPAPKKSTKVKSTSVPNNTTTTMKPSMKMSATKSIKASQAKHMANSSMAESPAPSTTPQPLTTTTQKLVEVPNVTRASSNSTGSSTTTTTSAPVTSSTPAPMNSTTDSSTEPPLTITVPTAVRAKLDENEASESQLLASTFSSLRRLLI